MRSHKELRNQTVETLSVIPNVTVVNAKPTPADIDDLPLINVFVEGFQTNRLTLKSNGWSGTVALKIIILVVGNNSWADQIDDLTATVFDTLMADAEWKSMFGSVSSINIQNDVQQESQSVIGRADITVTGTITQK